MSNWWFMKCRLFLTCFSFLTLAQANEADSASSEAVDIQYRQIEQDNIKNLDNIGQSYMNLLNQIGAAQNLSHAKNALALCAPTCKKIVNGSVWFEGVEHFVPQATINRRKSRILEH
ncbi:MAG: hypothetical protein ACHQT8_01250 [Chlamydiales bacterium]